MFLFNVGFVAIAAALPMIAIFDTLVSIFSNNDGSGNQLYETPTCAK